MKTLRQLLRDVTIRDVVGDADPGIVSVSRDSRAVDEHTAFVAIVGASVDGHDYAPALDVPAIVVQRPIADAAAAVQVVVDDTKLALAQLSAALEDHPGRSFPVVGVTGTNGKTTITTLMEQALEGLEWPVGRIGTTGNRVAGEDWPTEFTTPEAPQLQRLLRRMAEADCRAVLMEVSSIGLAQHRVDGIPFHTALFTNLTQDHLDFHGTMEAYGAAKARLFQELLRPVGGPVRAVMCADDPAWRLMLPPADCWTYGFATDADWRISGPQYTSEGSHASVRGPLGRFSLRTQLLGEHNLQNCLGAALGLVTLGVDPARAFDAVATVGGVPGRLEKVSAAGQPLVVVDYAHSPDAISTALRALRPYVDGRMWIVFGCGGDRDRGKRPLMGRAAERGADCVVLTSDNPRSEEPGSILDAIEDGMDQAPMLRDEDREAAIRWAVSQLAPGDVLLIAGKGHETTQEIAGVKHAFDDRVMARAALGGTNAV